MRVVITNAVSLNGGDAAIILGIETILRSALGPRLEISVHDDQPSEAARWLPLDVQPQLGSLAGRTRSRRALRRRLRTPDAKALLERYEAADVIVSSGGTYISENYVLDARLRELELAHRLGRPLVLFSQSIGPLWRRATRRALRRQLPRARLVLVRDERSLRELAAAGVRGARTALAADAAFALADPDVLARAAEPRPAAERPRVAVSVRAWSHFGEADARVRLERYLEAVAGLVRHLVERRGARVTFISTCQGEPAYPHDDSVVADAIAERLPGSTLAGVHVDRARHGPRELIDHLGEFDLVVATRMHAAILALCGGAPVLPIAYEPKTAELGEQLGIGNLVHEMASVSARGLRETADRLLDDAAGLRSALFPRVAEQRLSALASGALVREALSA